VECEHRLGELFVGRTRSGVSRVHSRAQSHVCVGDDARAIIGKRAQWKWRSGSSPRGTDDYCRCPDDAADLHSLTRCLRPSTRDARCRPHMRRVSA
jgi:hypothetical protein